MDKTIHFPALLIGKSFVEKLDYRYLVADKRSIPKKYHVLIVDSTGSCFDMDRVKQVGGFSLYYSIKLVGYIVRVAPVLNKPVYEINLSELKEIVIEIVKKHPKNFAAMYDGSSLTKKVNRAETIRQLIDIF